MKKGILAKNATLRDILDGEVLTGSRLESAAYGLQICHAIGEAFPDSELTGGARGMAKQAMLHNRWLSDPHRWPPAAKPGASWHHFLVVTGGTRGAIDIDIPGRNPDTWAIPALRALQAKNLKVHLILTEGGRKGYNHFQWLFGGGAKGNPGNVKAI